MNKRVFLFVALGLLVFASILFVGCEKNDGKTLYLFNWTYYTPDTVIAKFEEEFGVTVKADSYASNEEMFAKLKAGATGYDIVVPSQDYVSIMIKENMLREIDLEKIPNKKYISSLVLEKATYDPSMKYSVPYFMGAAGVAVNKTKVSQYTESWDIFANKKLNDRMCMMDDMREVIGDALAYLGYSVNTLDESQLNEAKNLIITQWKPNLVKFDAEGFGKSFASGDFWVVQGYAEAVFGEYNKDRWNEVDFFIPKEGGPMYIDSMVVLKDAKNYDLALEFINFIQRPEIYALFLDEFYFPPTVNTEAGKYMTVKPHYEAQELVACEIKDDLGAGLKEYNRIWQDIRFTD